MAESSEFAVCYSVFLRSDLFGQRSSSIEAAQNPKSGRPRSAFVYCTVTVAPRACAWQDGGHGHHHGSGVQAIA